MNIGRVRSQTHCPAELLRCLWQLALLSQRQAEILMDLPIIRLRHERRAELRNRLLALPLLQQSYAEVLVRVRVVRIEPQRFPKLVDGTIDLVQSPDLHAV